METPTINKICPVRIFHSHTSHWSNWITWYPETSIVSLHDTYINKTLTELPLYRVKSLLTDIFFLQQQNNPERYAHLMHYIILWKSQHPHGFRAVQLETEFLSWVTEYSWYINQLCIPVVLWYFHVREFSRFTYQLYSNLPPLFA